MKNVPHWTQVLLERDSSNGENPGTASVCDGSTWVDLRTSASQIEAFKKQRALEEKQRTQWMPTVLRLEEFAIDKQRHGCPNHPKRRPRCAM